MRSLVRSLGIMITVFAVAGMISGCMQRRMPAGPVPPLPPLVATPEDMKIIVAKVNGAAITRYSLINVMNRMEANNKRPAPDPREETRKKALDQLIFEELAFQEARRLGLKVAEGGVDATIATLKAKLGTEDEYKNFLAKQNLSEAELRSLAERALLIQLILDREVIKKSSFSEEDVRNEYELHKDQYLIPAKVIVEDVVLFLDQNDPASLTKANEILAKIKADKDKDPKNLVPDGTFIVRSRELDKEREPALYAAATGLKQQELSGVIKTRDSLHIIRLTEFLPEEQQSFEDVKGSLEAKVQHVAQKKRRRELEQELRKGATIELPDTRAQEKPQAEHKP